MTRGVPSAASVKSNLKSDAELAPMEKKPRCPAFPGGSCDGVYTDMLDTVISTVLPSYVPMLLSFNTGGKPGPQVSVGMPPSPQTPPKLLMVGEDKKKLSCATLGPRQFGESVGRNVGASVGANDRVGEADGPPLAVTGEAVAPAIGLDVGVLVGTEVVVVGAEVVVVGASVVVVGAEVVVVGASVVVVGAEVVVVGAAVVVVGASVVVVGAAVVSQVVPPHE